MGYTNHQTIIVTTYRLEYIEEAHRKAKEIFTQKISEILRAPVNDWYTFIIPTDGSKEGWEDSQVGDTQREAFKNWVKEMGFSDESNRYTCIELSYDEEGEIKTELVGKMI